MTYKPYLITLQRLFSSQPSRQPSRQPTSQPSSQPSVTPTKQPSRHPSNQPTRQPSQVPSAQPTTRPSRLPTPAPVTATPTVQSVPTIYGGSLTYADPCSTTGWINKVRNLPYICSAFNFEFYFHTHNQFSLITRNHCR